VSPAIHIGQPHQTDVVTSAGLDEVVPEAGAAEEHEPGALGALAQQFPDVPPPVAPQSCRRISDLPCPRRP
jgi:hypothetical protein